MTPLLPPAVLGFGLGAFADGIVLHQVLQWHHLTSAYTDDLQQAVLADGLFHVGAWLVVAASLVWAWRRPARRPGRQVLGAVLVGWGVFHGVDQVLFHMLLEAHHIRPGEHEQLYDWGYTALGGLLALVGLGLVRSGHDADRHPARP